MITRLYNYVIIVASLFVDERFGSAGYVSDFNSITCSETASENHMSDCDVQFSYSCTINSCATEYGIKCFSMLSYQCNNSVYNYSVMLL